MKHRITIDVEVRHRYSETFLLDENEYNQMNRDGAAGDKYLNELYEYAEYKGDTEYDYAVFDEDTGKQIIDWL